MSTECKIPFNFVARRANAVNKRAQFFVPLVQSANKFDDLIAYLIQYLTLSLNVNAYISTYAFGLV